MLHFFALSENKSGTHLNYTTHIKALVNSAKKNTTLKSIFIYDGKPNELTTWLRKNNVTVVYHKSSIADILIDNENNPNISKGYKSHIALGTFLRLDIPLIIEKLKLDDGIVIYTDCDIIFNKDIPTPEMSCSIALAPEFNFTPENLYYNSGVMLIDTAKFRLEREGLIDFIKEEVNEHRFQDYDQTAICMYYYKRHDILNALWNWRVFYGINEDAMIIHYQSMRIEEMENCIKTGKHSNPQLQNLYDNSPEGIQHYHDLFKKYL